MKKPAGAVIALLFAAVIAAAGQDDPPSPGGVRILPADTAPELAAKAARVVPSDRQVAWQALEFQAFVHFGMNTFTDREWGLGTEDPKLFNPTDFDASQWVEAVKSAGMRGVIVTAKHHDGFCLWPSRHTEHSVRNSPWKNGRGDVVGDVAAACRKAGLKFGIYLSPWDRHEPSYGDSPRYNEHFKNQLRELLSGYGEISEVWFDGACAEGPNGKRQAYDWDGYFGLIRELRPGAAISIMGPDARWIGNEAGVTRESEWSVIPVPRMDNQPDEKNPGGVAGLDAQAEDLGSLKAVEAVAKKGGRLIWYPGQVDVSIRPGWFYHAAEDMKAKTLDHLLEIYYTSVGGNAQLLLNIPPDRRGRIHENDARRLKELGDALKATFAVNLAAGARAAAGPEGRQGGAFGAALTLDGDPATCWRPAKGGPGAAIVYDLGRPRTFNVALVQENIRLGQRVESLALDAWDGNEWKEAARGTTVGWKRLLRFGTMTASKVRLRILGSRLEPAISEFGLYLDPARAARHPAVTPVPRETPGLKDFVLDLDGAWKFSPVPPRDFWRVDVDPSSWPSIEVPGEWAAQGHALAQDAERVYKRRIDIPASFAGRALLLRFDGVYSYARVWIDGEFVRDHHGGFTSFECDITGLVRPGEPAWITVGVTDMSDEISWGSSYAKHNIGGILQDVRIVALPAVHARRFHAEAGLDQSCRNGILKVTAGVDIRTAASAEVRLSLRDDQGKTVPLSPSVIRLTSSGPERTSAIPVGPVRSWDAEHPRLYTLEARVVVAGKTVEILRKNVGFRTVEVAGNKLLVNGREVKLRGGCRHNVHPLSGRSVTAGLDEKDVLLFRDANINFIRTSHYPPTEAFLDACDKYGMYVEEENAVCFVATHGNLPSSEDAAFGGRYMGQFAEMVERDRSHASVVIWSLGNESRWGRNVNDLYRHVKAEDPSRPVIWSYPDTVPKGTSGYDIYSYHYPNFDADLKSPARPMLNDEWAHVACYNVETLKRDPGVRDFWGESLKMFWENAFASDGCLGGAIWGLIDDVFFLPGSTAGYGEWGIIDGWRRPKPEYWHVKKAYSPVRIADSPLLDAVPGRAIRIPVKNWFDHTALDELSIRWTLGLRSGTMAGPKVAARGEGAVIVPADDWKTGDILRLQFVFRDGRIVDEFALPLGAPGPAVQSAPQGPPPAVIEGEKTIAVSGPGFRVLFSRATGLIERAERDGKALIVGGPIPAAAPAAFMPWSLSSVEARPGGNEAVVDIRGSFAGTLARFLVRIDGRGLMTVEYDLGGRPSGAGEMGLAFILPGDTASLSWARRGLHSVYPDGHIGRNVGTALKARGGPPDIYRVPPDWPWAGDMKDFFLWGKDHGGYGATRDFRGLRANVLQADVGFSGTDCLLRFEGTGSEAVRAETLPDGRVRLNLLAAWAFSDLDWGNYEGRKELPESFRGVFRLKI